MVAKDDIGLKAIVGDDFGHIGGVEKGHGMGGEDSSDVWAKVREAVGPMDVRNALTEYGLYWKSVSSPPKLEKVVWFCQGLWVGLIVGARACPSIRPQVKEVVVC